MIIAIDFDGTCVTHEYPFIGKDIGAVVPLQLLNEAGHQLILWTIRSGKELEEAGKWFDDNKILLFGVNQTPGQKNWSSSPKAYAQLYIDDAAFGAPLIYPRMGRPHFDWETAMLTLKELIPNEQN